MGRELTLSLPKGIKITRIQRHTPEWFAYRLNGIGASELGTVMRQKYWDETGIWGLWEEKIGLKPVSLTVTETMLHGLNQEEYISDLWQFWDNRVDQDGNPAFIQRWMEFEQAKLNKTGNKNDFVVRACQRVNGFVTNPDFPILYVSLDRWAFPDQYQIDFSTKSEFGFPVEFKNLGEFVAKKYISGIPEYYHSQGQAQMGVCKVEYMEFGALSGGNKFNVNAFNLNKKYMAEIVYETTEFWNKNVLPGREIVAKIREAEMKGDQNRQVELYEELQANYAPVPIESDAEAHYAYLTERALRELDPLSKSKGSDESYQAALKWNIWDKWKNYCNNKAQIEKNIILKEMLDRNIFVQDYGKDWGRITLVNNGNSIYPKNSLKATILERELIKHIPQDIVDPERFFE